VTTTDEAAATDAAGAAEGAGRVPFWWVVGAALVVAVGVRLAYTAGSTVPSEPGFLVSYDPIYYHQQALAVADGHGFVAPYRTDGAPSADHPPLLVLVLAAASKLGLSSFGAHRAVTALIGAAVVPLLALLARRLAGPRAGMITAALAAVAPVLWANDGQLMPEPLYAVLVAAALLVAHQLWDGDPLLRRATGLGSGRWSGQIPARYGALPAAAVLGALIGLAGLARGEGLMLLGFTVGPVALWAPALSGWRTRLAVVAVAGVATVAVLAPWLAYNDRRFEERVLVSSSADSAFAGANCDQTYAGPGLGGWTSDCFARHSNQTLEESVFSSRLRADARAYVGDHQTELPKVATARVGRLWGVFRTGQGVDLDELQNRPRPVAWAGLGTLVLLVPCAVAGALRLRRAGRPVVLLAALPVMVTVVAAVFYGNPRFRVPADLALVVLAAVAVDGWLRRAHR
jgi:4-amino-4-deoxy-L-arabinose transferase-like glycosyltransferase